MKVLDTSAVLAVLYEEDGAEVARRALPGAAVSLVNVAEIVGDMVLGGGDRAKAESTLRDLDLEWVMPDEDQALRAAAMRPMKGLSLGDRFCIALAQARSASVVTADQAWKKAGLGVAVELIR